VVALRVRVPAEAVPGKELVYRIAVVNCSKVDAHHVTVRNPLPANVRFVRASPEPVEVPQPKAATRVLTWQFGTLAACARKDIELVVVPSGAGDIQNCARVQFEHGQCVRTRIAGPGLRVRKVGPSEALLYDIISFKLEVTNTGKAPARKVKLTDTLPDGLDFQNSKPATSGEGPVLTWDLGELAPGQTKQVDYQAIPKKTGTFSNQAVVEAEGGARDQASLRVRVGQPVLDVATVGPQHRLVSRPATYRITVRNTGTMPATNVQVTDDLPPDIRFVGASGGGRLAGDEVRWSLGRLEPGGRRTVQVEVRARKAGTFKNVVTASADRGLTEQGKAETKFEEVEGLALEVDKGEGAVEVGRELVANVRVLNTGKAAQTNVALTLLLPEGLRLVQATRPSEVKPDGRKVVFDKVKAVPAGGEVVYWLKLRGARAGPAQLQAEAASDQAAGAAAVKVEETFIVTGPAAKARPPG
jgi:uncharacterized repeat protein (TIGR01451 family)